MTPDSLRIIFMGTPDFAVPTLAALHAAGHIITAVYTRAPKPKGRGQQMTMSPVHQYALDHDLGPVMTPASFRRDRAAVDEFLGLACDVVAVAAYGLILPPAVLQEPRFGCLNVHGSLLPRWRGAAPIHHAIWAGDTQTGITIMQMDAGLDTGDMIVHDVVPMTATTTTPMLHDALASLGAELMSNVINDLAAGKIVPRTPQPDAGVTIAPMLKKEDAIIDWAQPAVMIDRQVRALMPWPGTITHNDRGQDIKIISGKVINDTTTNAAGVVINRDGDIACGQGTIYHVQMVQVPSGKKMSVADAVNGGHVTVGEVWR